MYGPVVLNTFQTNDLVAPGMPVFTNLEQVSNSVVRATLAMPVMDSDGGNLTGLTKLTVATMAMAGVDNPFEALSMAEIVAMAGVTKIVVTISPADAGTEKSVDVPVTNLGGFQAFAAACSD